MGCAARRVGPASYGQRDIDVQASLDYLEDHGGYCDCEILMNVRRAESVGCVDCFRSSAESGVRWKFKRSVIEKALAPVHGKVEARTAAATCSSCGAR